MTFYEVLEQVVTLLQRHGRMSYRALTRQFQLDEAYLEDLKAELVDIQRVAVDQDGTMLVWAGAAPAALAMQEAMRRYSAEVRRTHGVEVVVRAIDNDLHMDYSAVGQTTHLAARMEQLATPGSIRLTAATLRLVEGLVQVTALGPVPVKGLAEPVEVFELTGASGRRRRLQVAAARGLTHFYPVMASDTNVNWLLIRVLTNTLIDASDSTSGAKRLQRRREEICVEYPAGVRAERSLTGLPG